MEWIKFNLFAKLKSYMENGELKCFYLSSIRNLKILVSIRLQLQNFCMDFWDKAEVFIPVLMSTGWPRLYLVKRFAPSQTNTSEDSSSKSYLPSVLSFLPREIFENSIWSCMFFRVSFLACFQGEGLGSLQTFKTSYVKFLEIHNNLVSVPWWSTFWNVIGNTLTCKC